MILASFRSWDSRPFSYDHFSYRHILSQGYGLAKENFFKVNHRFPSPSTAGEEGASLPPFLPPLHHHRVVVASHAARPLYVCLCFAIPTKGNTFPASESRATRTKLASSPSSSFLKSCNNFQYFLFFFFFTTHRARYSR